MKNGNAQSREMTIGQYSQFISAVFGCLPSDISPEDAQYWIENRHSLRERLSEVLIINCSEDIVGIKVWWQNFYKKYFNITLDFSEVKIPNYKRGFDFIVIIPKGLTIRRVLSVIRTRMDLSPCEDNFAVINDRDAKKGHYAVRFRDEIEADERTENMSANNLKARNILGATVLERLIMELAYLERTDGQHLDPEGWTLCSGSRCADGSVFYIGWHFKGSYLLVRSYGANNFGPSPRARVAIV